MSTLLVLDLDGTLIGTSGDLHPDTLPVLAQLTASGVSVALATGRPVHDALAWGERTGAHHVIPVNGAAVLRVGDRAPLWASAGLPAELVGTITTLAACHDLRVHLHTLNAWYASQDDDVTRAYAQRHGIAPRLDAWTDGAAPVLLAELTGGRGALRRFRAVLPPGVSVAETFDHVGTPYLDITAPGVDKGAAVRRLGALLNVPPSRITAMGNGENDRAMFAAAATSVAVQGSPLALIERATHAVALTADDGAVPTTLRALYDNHAPSRRYVRSLARVAGAR